jgi:hypothetical protein
MNILRIVLTSALIAGAVGAGVFCIVSASLRFSDLMESRRKFKEWEEEQKEFEKW